jgi:hypothetical protein
MYISTWLQYDDYEEAVTAHEEITSINKLQLPEGMVTKKNV